MAHLSPCYFCGTALESPVQTYELSGGTGGSRTTVSLCPSCKEKLDIVLESTGRGTLGAADERLESTAAGHERGESGDTSQSGRGGDTGDQQGRPGDDQPSDSDPAQTGPETGSSEEDEVATERQGSPDASAEPDEMEDHQETGSGGEFDVGSKDLAADEDPFTAEDESLGDDGVDEKLGDIDDGEELDDTDNREELGDIDDGELEVLDDAFEDDEVLSDEDPSADESKENPLASETETEPTDETTGESSDREPTPDSEDDETEGQTPSETTISALEYNRVMRMLQNREFPVDREEIVVVASNAYDIAQSECNQVIDLAVDRGILEERDGELYRPED